MKSAGPSAAMGIYTAVHEGRILQRLHSAGRVDIVYHGRIRDRNVTLEEILATPSEYVVDDRDITLDLEERLEMMGLLDDEDKKRAYLRALVRDREGSSEDGEDGPSCALDSISAAESSEGVDI